MSLSLSLSFAFFHLTSLSFTTSFPSLRPHLFPFLSSFTTAAAAQLPLCLCLHFLSNLSAFPPSSPIESSNRQSSGHMAAAAAAFSCCCCMTKSVCVCVCVCLLSSPAQSQFAICRRRGGLHAQAFFLLLIFRKHACFRSNAELLLLLLLLLSNYQATAAAKFYYHNHHQHPPLPLKTVE